MKIRGKGRAGLHCAMKSRGGGWLVAREGLVALLRDKGKEISGCMRKKFVTHWSGSHRTMKSGGGGVLVSRRERDLGKVISGCMQKRKVTHWSGSHHAMKSRGGGWWYRARGTCYPSER